MKCIIILRYTTFPYPTCPNNQIKERTSELEMLQKDVTRELDEIENLKAQNASVSERIRELTSLEV